MRATVKKLVVVVILLILLPTVLSAQEVGPLARWIQRTKAHRIFGYTTLGVATVTAGLGMLGVEVHPYFGAATAGLAVTTASLGAIAYRERLSWAWPHAVLNGLAASGFLLNAFVWAGGSPPHIATGIASLVSMYGAYGTIILLTR